MFVRRRMPASGMHGAPAKRTSEHLSGNQGDYMNKAELVEAIVKKTGGTKAAAEATLDAFLDTVTATLIKGESVALVGFGTFGVSKRAARKGRNPSTGAEIKIPASRVAKFSAGAKLKKAVNKK
jgi:DNA-binding protein HU-beta